MNTVRRLLYREIVQAVGFVALGFLALFLFFDLVEELQNLTKLAAQGYRLQHAFWMIATKIPSHLYDLLPISVLIGTIFVMARLAQSSEFTILRSGGLGPGKALGMLLKLGWVFALLTLLLGDYASPWAEQQGVLLKARFRGDVTSGQTGAWLKERQGEQHLAINIRAMNPEQKLLDVRIQRFNAQGALLESIHAQEAQFSPLPTPDTDAQTPSQETPKAPQIPTANHVNPQDYDNAWLLRDVQVLQVQRQGDSARLQPQHLPQLLWPTQISPDMVSAALVSAERMNIWDLALYTRHLSQNQQNAQPYEIQLWRKVFYPLSCFVMLTLALPFAYLHFRSGQIAGHVFGGVMAGISFYLLNNVFSHVGNLRNWEPWLTSAAPSLLYTLASLAAFAWMVLRR